MAKDTVNILLQHFTQKERLFLVSFKHCAPDWHYSGIANLATYPAVKWKLLNIQKMTEAKRSIAIKKLMRVLQM